MTKYILVGGYPVMGPSSGKDLCSAMFDGLPSPIKLIDCLFSRPEESWPQGYIEDSQFFISNSDKAMHVSLASMDNFLEQLKTADAIYFRGGDVSDLINRLSRFPGWEKLVVGKVVVGSSAGAMMMSKYNYSPESKKIDKGLGILNIKFIPHYKSDYNGPDFDWDAVYNQIDRYHEKLPVLALSEGQFSIIEQ